MSLSATIRSTSEKRHVSARTIHSGAQRISSSASADRPARLPDRLGNGRNAFGLVMVLTCNACRPRRIRCGDRREDTGLPKPYGGENRGNYLAGPERPYRDLLVDGRRLSFIAALLERIGKLNELRIAEFGADK